MLIRVGPLQAKLSEYISNNKSVTFTGSEDLGEEEE